MDDSEIKCHKLVQMYHTYHKFLLMGIGPSFFVPRQRIVPRPPCKMVGNGKLSRTV